MLTGGVSGIRRVAWRLEIDNAKNKTRTRQTQGASIVEQFTSSILARAEAENTRRRLPIVSRIIHVRCKGELGERLLGQETLDPPRKPHSKSVVFNSRGQHREREREREKASLFLSSEWWWCWWAEKARVRQWTVGTVRSPTATLSKQISPPPPP